MKRKFSFRTVLLLVALLVPLLPFGTQSSRGQTIVMNDIESDTNWTSSGSPYVVIHNITVAQSATLQISEGVEVKFDRAARLTIEGSLVIRGVNLNEVIFDSNYSNPLPGEWEGIVVNSTGIVQVEYCVLRHATMGFRFLNSTGGRIENCTFDEIQLAAVSALGSENISVSQSVFKNISDIRLAHMIFESSRHIHISENDFVALVDDAKPVIVFHSSSDIELLGNTIHGRGESITAFEMWNSSNILVRENSLVDVGVGLFLAHGENATVAFNNASVSERGIWFQGWVGASLSGNMIQGGVEGVYSFTSNEIDIEGSQIDNATKGVRSLYSQVLIQNSTISSVGVSSLLVEDSHVTVLNTSFDKGLVEFYDIPSNSTKPELEVKWFMNIRAINEFGRAIDDATVEVRDLQGDLVRSGFTDLDGTLKWVIAEEYNQTDRNGDRDGEDPGERSFETPHNVTAVKDAITGYAIPDPYMNESKTVLVVLNLSCPPMPPSLRGAELTGGDLSDVFLSWDSSEDDGGGENDVVRYDIHRSTTFDGAYELVGNVPANGSLTYEWTCLGCGVGDPDNYFFYVEANDSLLSTTSPNRAGKFTHSLSQGPNLISLPLIQSNESIERVLQTAPFDKTWYYDSLDQEWRSYMKFKSYSTLDHINHTMGVWINAIEDSNLTVAGIVPSQTVIHLYKGWNLVGFPSFNSAYTVADLKVDTGTVRVEGCYSMPPFYVRVLGDPEAFLAGQGYWVRVEVEATWRVDIQ